MPVYTVYVYIYTQSPELASKKASLAGTSSFHQSQPEH